MTLVVVLGLLVDGYDPVRNSMSELGAVDAPPQDVRCPREGHPVQTRPVDPPLL